MEAISDDGKYLLTKNGAYDIADDRFAWTWQHTLDGLKPLGATIIDEEKSRIVNVLHELITVKDLRSGRTLQQFNLVLPEDKTIIVTDGIFSSELNKLVLKHEGPETLIVDLSK